MDAEMTLHDLLLMRIEAPRHSWKWLLGELQHAGVKTPRMDIWLKQVYLGIPYHEAAATMLALEEIRDEFCSCSDHSKCRTCKMTDRMVEDVV